jgi:hypothetical protein
MAAPVLGQMVWVDRPLPLDHVFDPAFVLTNVGTGTYVGAGGGTFYTVTALVFSPTMGNGLAPQIVSVNLYPDRATADTYRSAQGAPVWVASVL